jgi:hypothetical protein
MIIFYLCNSDTPISRVGIAPSVALTTASLETASVPPTATSMLDTTADIHLTAAAVTVAPISKVAKKTGSIIVFTSLTPVATLTADTTSTTPVATLTADTTSTTPVATLTADTTSTTPVATLTANSTSTTPVATLTANSTSTTPIATLTANSTSTTLVATLTTNSTSTTPCCYSNC